MSDRPGVLRGRRIGVFGKGGCGKSTVLVLLTRALLGRGYEVCVVDADSTNVGLAAALGLASPPASLMRRFGGTAFKGGPVTCPVDDPMPLANAGIDLDVLEPQYVSHDGRGLSLVTLGKITEAGAGAGCDGPVAKIARDLDVRRQGRAVLTLLDFKAGFEDWARGVITTLDWALVVVDPTTAAVEMMGRMDDVLGQIRAGAAPATRHLDDARLVEAARALYRNARTRGVLCVLNKVADRQSEAYLRDRLARYSIEPVAVVREEARIGRAWLRGEPLLPGPLGEAADDVVAALEAAEVEAAIDARPAAKPTGGVG